MKTKSKTIEWVCDDCGIKYGNWHQGGFYSGPAPHYATYHLGHCDLCGKDGDPVTEPRDYGYLINEE